MNDCAHEFDVSDDRAHYVCRHCEFSKPRSLEADLVGSKAEMLLRSVRVSTVEPKPIHWLWQDKIALGKLTLLSGDPGLGKSLVSLAITAAVSLGARWPVGADTAPQGSVVMLSAEDGIADTIRPRLDAAGANCEAVHVVQASIDYDKDDEPSERLFSLATDIDAMEVFIRRLGDCKLVVIDPISAYLGKTDSHKNAEVRAVLSPVATLAEKLNVAVVAITHLNKGAGSAMYRSIGSIAFTAAARASWVVTKDRDDPHRRLVLPVKNNLAQDRLGMAYRVETGEAGAPVVMWEPNPVDIDINDALSTMSDEFGGMRRDAIDWLQTELKDGPVSSKDMQKRAREAGHSWATVRRAQVELGIKPYVRKFAQGWWWDLPNSLNQDAQGAHVQKPEQVEHLGQNQGVTNGSGAQGAQGAHPGEREHLDDSRPGETTDDGKSEIF